MKQNFPGEFPLPSSPSDIPSSLYDAAVYNIFVSLTMVVISTILAQSNEAPGTVALDLVGLGLLTLIVLRYSEILQAVGPSLGLWFLWVLHSFVFYTIWVWAPLQAELHATHAAAAAAVHGLTESGTPSPHPGGPLGPPAGLLGPWATWTVSGVFLAASLRGLLRLAPPTDVEQRWTTLILAGVVGFLPHEEQLFHTGLGDPNVPWALAQSHESLIILLAATRVGLYGVVAFAWRVVYTYLPWDRRTVDFMIIIQAAPVLVGHPLAWTWTLFQALYAWRWSIPLYRPPTLREHVQTLDADIERGEDHEGGGSYPRRGLPETGWPAAIARALAKIHLPLGLAVQRCLNGRTKSTDLSSEAQKKEVPVLQDVESGQVISYGSEENGLGGSDVDFDQSVPRSERKIMSKNQSHSRQSNASPVRGNAPVHPQDTSNQKKKSQNPHNRTSPHHTSKSHPQDKEKKAYESGGEEDQSKRPGSQGRPRSSRHRSHKNHRSRLRAPSPSPPPEVQNFSELPPAWSQEVIAEPPAHKTLPRRLNPRAQAGESHGLRPQMGWSADAEVDLNASGSEEEGPGVY